VRVVMCCDLPRNLEPAPVLDVDRNLVARKVWLPIFVWMQAAFATRGSCGRNSLAHRAACEGIEFSDRGPELWPLGIRATW
jgi:hypothetical protein